MPSTARRAKGTNPVKIFQPYRYGYGRAVADEGHMEVKQSGSTIHLFKSLGVKVRKRFLPETPLEKTPSDVAGWIETIEIARWKADLVLKLCTLLSLRTLG